MLATAALALLVGCAHQSMPVQLQGDPVSIAWLAGKWDGEYWGGRSGRRGSLSFRLESGTDSLHGDVLMSDPKGNVMLPTDPAVEHRVHARSPQRLRIDFVAAHADSVHGVLEPYFSPDCSCAVTTIFAGKVVGDEITGTFTTRGAPGDPVNGSWRMTRVATIPR